MFSQMKGKKIFIDLVGIDLRFFPCFGLGVALEDNGASESLTKAWYLLLSSP